jgi:TetR/AcrR family transcriptional regulator
MNQPVENIRDRILTEATRLFAENGVSGTSIQAIAQAAGITRPTLVYHFGSKEGLRTEVLSTLMAHWRDELPRIMAAAASGGPTVDSLLGALFSFFRADPARARLLLREMLDRPQPMSELLRETVQPFTNMLTQAVRMGQASGVVRPALDPEAFTVLVIASAIGVVAIGDHTAALMNPEPVADQLQTELTRMARHALLNPPPEET